LHISERVAGEHEALVETQISRETKVLREKLPHCNIALKFYMGYS
jgi:hypothetical protein